MSFDARHPDLAPDPHAVPAHFGLAKVPPEVLAKVGETFAAALAALQRQLAGLGGLTSDARHVAWRAALHEIDRLEHLGVRVQQVARVLAGDGAPTIERFDLAAAARQSVAEWSAAAQRRGVRLVGPTEPISVDASAGVVEQLLDLLIDHALHIGTTVQIDAGLQGRPPCPMLTVRVQCGASDPPPAADGADSVHWQLFALLARASGLSPQRVVAGRTVTLMLGFTPSGSGAGAPMVRSAALLPRTPAAAGREVLLVEPRDSTRLLAHRLMQLAGMRVDAASSIEQARAGLQGRSPDALITGYSASDAECTALIDELRQLQPRLRVIELVDDDNAFTLSLPGASQAGRVGRSDLARTLVIAVSQELGAAWEAAD